MALSANALTSLAAVKAYLGLGDDAHDNLLESLIEAVSAQFMAHTGRHLAARDYSPDPANPAYAPDHALLDGSGYAEQLLPQYPVRGVSQLLLDGILLPPALGPGQAGYLVDAAAGVLSLTQGVFTRGRHNLAISYRAGFDQIPAELFQACLEQVVVRFQESAAGQGRLGVSARTLPDGSVSYASAPLLPQVAAVLDRYRGRSLL